MDKGLLAEDSVDMECNLQQFMPPPKRSNRGSRSSRSSHISVEFTNEAELLREADELASMDEQERFELRKSKDSFHLPRKQKETMSLVFQPRHGSASLYSNSRVALNKVSNPNLYQRLVVFLKHRASQSCYSLWQVAASAERECPAQA